MYLEDLDIIQDDDNYELTIDKIFLKTQIYMLKSIKIIIIIFIVFTLIFIIYSMYKLLTMLNGLIRVKFTNYYKCCHINNIDIKIPNYNIKKNDRN